jgi:hypothetical protein
MSSVELKSGVTRTWRYQELFIKKNLPKQVFYYFGSQGIVTPAWLKRPVRRRYRWRLKVLLLRSESPNPKGFCIAPLSTSLLLALSKPFIPHKHSRRKMLMVEMSAYDSRVQNTFCSASYSDTTTYQSTMEPLPLRNPTVPPSALILSMTSSNKMGAKSGVCSTQTQW